MKSQKVDNDAIGLDTLLSTPLCFDSVCLDTSNLDLDFKVGTQTMSNKLKSI